MTQQLMAESNCQEAKSVQKNLRDYQKIFVTAYHYMCTGSK